MRKAVQFLNSRIMLTVIMTMAMISCSTPKALVYQDLQRFRVHNIDFQKITMALDMQFYNPNGYGLSLKNGNIDGYINGNYIGKASVDEQTKVPAKDTFTLPVVLTAELRTVIANALEIWKNNGKEVRVRLSGSIRAGKGGVFVPVPIRYEGTQRLQF